MTRKRAMMIGLDGADPAVIKQMIAEGKLPNFKKFLEQGVAHNSLGMLGVNPTVTPPNWTSMATGNWPRTHGVTDFFTYFRKSIRFIPIKLGFPFSSIRNDLGVF